MRRHLALAATLLALGAVGLPAGAAPLPPGSTLIPPYSATAETGTLLATTTQSFTTDGATPLIGTLTSSVYNSTGLPGGTLDFVYQVSVSPSSTVALEGLSVGNFAGVTILNAAVVGPGNQPTDITRPSNPNPNANGATVHFDYTNPNVLAIGATSPTFILRTGLTGSQYSLALNASAQDTLSVNVNAYGPTAVPEPSSVVMMGIGAVALCGVALRRKAKAAR